MKLNGSQIIIEVLLEHGVDLIFGYPGGAVLNIYDALYDYQNRIRHILTAHEQGAAHAADGYARATGKVGVCLATSGPGATNLVTGIATAFADSVPLVCITGNVTQPLIGRDSFQEVYTTGITMPITKHNMVVRHVEELANCLRSAFQIANSGRKGPVLVDIPKDLTSAFTDYEPLPPVLPPPIPAPAPDLIAAVAKEIAESKRPVLYYGGGVISSQASEELNLLAEKADIPACHTMMGTGVMGYGDRHNIGLVGMHGCRTTNYAVEKCDLLLAVGVRFSDRVALNPQHFAPEAKVIHIDIDAAEIDKNIHAYHAVVGDVKQVLTCLLPMVQAIKRPEWMEQISKWQSEDYLPVDDNTCLKPHQLLSAISEKIGADALFVTDVGQHQLWAAQYCGRTKPRSFLTSGGLGTMGFGYGAAIGAQLAFPGRRVIHITGDASFHMNLNECCTTVSYGLPVITIIMNNSVLGMIRQWQHSFYNNRFSSTSPERKTDFVKLAEAFGATGYRCNTLAEFQAVFEKALTSNGPVLIDCAINKDEMVLPMIPSGGTVKDILMG